MKTQTAADPYPASPKAGTTSGFTLVELLLGLAMGAIIGVSIYNVFWSAMKLDGRMRRVHDNYMELLLADQAMTHDLENAIPLDFSASYPDAVVFDGQAEAFSFLTQTKSGIKRVSYFSGTSESGPEEKAMIGRVVNPLSAEALQGPSPVEFLFRRQSSLADWLNETTDNTYTQMVAAGLKKGSFNCHYAPFVKDLHNSGAEGLDYADSWNAKGIPMAVSCSFTVFDPQRPGAEVMFKREMYLAPVPSYYGNEQ